MMYGSLCSSLAFLVKMIELEMSESNSLPPGGTIISDVTDGESSEGVISSARSDMKERTRSVIVEADIEILLW